MTVNFPNEERVVVAAAIVRWVRGQGQVYGLETLMVEKQTHRRVGHVVKHLVQESWESST